MDKFLEQLKHAGHAVRFAPERKKHVRDYLVRMTAADVVLRAPRKEYRTFGSFFLRPMSVLAGIMGLVLLGGSTSLASQNALPGDVLYPVKVGVTEKIVEAIQFTPDAQAEYAAELAERRLDEAAKLAERGDIAESVEEELTERFDEHASRARVALETVRSRDAERAERIAAAFEDAIHTRQLALGIESEEDAAFGAVVMLAAPADVPAPDTAVEAPVLMMAAIPATSTAATSSAPSPFVSSSSEEEPELERTMKQGEDAPRRSKPTLKTKVRDTLREIREFRSQMEARRSELRLREERGDDDVQPRWGAPTSTSEDDGASERTRNRGGDAVGGEAEEDEQEKD